MDAQTGGLYRVRSHKIKCLSVTKQTQIDGFSALFHQNCVHAALQTSRVEPLGVYGVLPHRRRDSRATRQWRRHDTLHVTVVGSTFGAFRSTLGR